VLTSMQKATSWRFHLMLSIESFSPTPNTRLRPEAIRSKQAKEPCTAFWPSEEASTVIFMNRTCLLIFALFLLDLPIVNAEESDKRNFAIDTCNPNKNEIARAEARAKRFWAKHSSRFGAEPRFLAVETSKIFPGEVQDLWSKLINSETTASFFSYGMEDNTYSNLSPWRNDLRHEDWTFRWRSGLHMR
jgi:hypothetical protein